MTHLLAACLLASTLCMSACVTTAAQASDWPERPIQIIVGVPAGGGLDTTARIFAQALAKPLGQAAIIVNQPGASGTLAVNDVIRSPPDGNKALIVSSLDVTAQLTTKVPTYDLRTSLRSIGLLVEFPYVIVSSKDSKIASIGDLVSRAKAKPGDIAYGSAGVGSGNQILIEQVSDKLGISLLHVPYRGNVPALTDLLSSQISLLADGVTTQMELARSGRVNAIAVTSRARWPGLPNVPTLSETIPQFSFLYFIGFAVHAKTPENIVGILTKATGEALADETLKRRFAEMGARVAPAGPTEMNRLMGSQIESLSPLVDRLNIKRGE